MKNYTARVLVEHIITPQPQDYSAFSELIVLGKTDLPLDLEYSQLLFDNKIDILAKIQADLAQEINDNYLNAMGEGVQLVVREIAKIEDCPSELDFQKPFIELDERLYTFGKRLTFEQFKDLYEVGKDVED